MPNECKHEAKPRNSEVKAMSHEAMHVDYYADTTIYTSCSRAK